MSRKLLEYFQTTHSDPNQPAILPSRTAKRLAITADYLPSVPKVLSVSDVALYNGILKHDGKEAADNWLNVLWA